MVAKYSWLVPRGTWGAGLRLRYLNAAVAEKDSRENCGAVV
jgi:hypothetical protein